MNGLYIAAGDHQLIGCTGMPQAVKDDVWELWVRILTLLELLANQDRFNCQTVRQTQEHIVFCRGVWVEEEISAPKRRIRDVHI